MFWGWWLEPGVYERGNLDFGALFEYVLRVAGDGSCGAVAFFIGVTKRAGREGKDVEALEMESYVEHANRAIARICEEVKREYGLRFVGVWHLVGRFGLGEPIVMVAAAGLTRDAVFKGLREAVERYKREPALFKKEIYVDGTHLWVEGA